MNTARIIVSAIPLIAVPISAANGQIETGVVSIGPAMFLFTLAAALFLTLVFRTSASHLARFITQKAGQWRIHRALAKRSTDVLHDFILPGAYGGLAKLDHAILTAGGILCIQTKHYNGVVFGAEDEAQWTNVDGVSKRRFLNPLIQNEGRTRALQKIVPDVPVANLVIFTGAVEFTSPPPANVIHVRDLESYVAKYVFGPSKVEDWDAVWLTVKAAALTDDATRKDLQAQVGFS
ncbi:MAG: NERD domain-containing protein [Gammaproteobacteria bacterium]|nr:NERD domain-containing protein [Gammaproteobacteria bacterium]